MSRQKKILFITVLLTSGFLISTLIVHTLLSLTYANEQYEAAADFTDWLIKEYPEEEQNILNYIKNDSSSEHNSGPHVIDAYGYSQATFWNPYRTAVIASSLCAMLLLLFLTGLLLTLNRQKTRARIHAITELLMKANRGQDAPLFSDIEDDFSVLEDELSKTVAEMRVARETAVKERQNYADSLANIAHQIKTPITALSAAAQMMEHGMKQDESRRFRKQIDQIHQLTDALLTISRIDAGVLELKQETVNVYTMLELSVEALEDHIQNKQIEIILPNHPDISYIGDLEWSVEVFINLIKNSIDHMADHGRLELCYEENPLYVELSVSDDGKGFEAEELPYIFNRFYRGKQITGSGTGIGLSMAKSIIEMQNGFITAKNLQPMGACFIIRFYCH